MVVFLKRALGVGLLAVLVLGGAYSPAHAAPPPEPGWRIFHSSPEFAGDEYTDLAVTGPDDAWAVGSEPCCQEDPRKISHWDGTAWQDVPPPALPDGIRYPALAHVAGSAPQNIWVFGLSTDGVAFGHHWDGSTWQTTVFGPDLQILDAVVLGPENAWFVGTKWNGEADRPIAQHYDGRTWTTMPLPATAESVSALSANRIWAIGLSDKGTVVAMRWNGTAWRQSPLPLPSLPPDVRVRPADIVAVRPGEVWASGQLVRHEGLPGALLWRWNGLRWARARIDAPEETLSRLAPDGQGGLWIVSQGTRPSASLLHYGSGRLLSREPAPVQPGTDAGIEALALVPGTRSLWAAGVLNRADGEWAAAIYRYDPAAATP